MSAGEKLRFWPPILSQIAQGRVKRRVMEKAIINRLMFFKDCPCTTRTVLIRKESCSVRAPGRKLWKSICWQLIREQHRQGRSSLIIRAISSQSSSTEAMLCVEKMIVAPFSFSCRISSLSISALIGSKPLKGSSKISSDGA